MSTATLEPQAQAKTHKITQAINPDALNALLGRMVNDLGASISGALIVLGDRLGIYRALHRAGPSTSAELATASRLDERHLREWLAAQAASGYIAFEASTQKFSLTPEQAAVFADPHSPAAMTGGFYSVSAAYHDEPLVAESFRTGRGVAWEDHHNCLFCGVDRFFRPGYEANLVAHWIPALQGMVDKLTFGARVADVGCGRGSSTLILAAAFPASEFTGYDLHRPSIEMATSQAKEKGLGNVRFEAARAQNFPGTGYALVTMFDALHDMGDPVAAATHIRQSLAPGGTLMLVEPRAGDNLEDNLNPVGRAYYGFSTMICTPGAISQSGGMALGAQAGDQKLKEVLHRAGFTKVRRAAETPFNVVIEARV